MYGASCYTVGWVMKDIGMKRAYGRRILYVEVQVDFLVSVLPGFFEKNDRQGTGLTRAKVPGDDGNESTIC